MGFALLVVTKTNAQNKLNGAYGATGISISNGATFKDATFPWIEVGLDYEKFDVGLNLGRGSLNFKDDDITQYYAELKGSTDIVTFSTVKGYAICGVGTFLNTKQVFIEYGLGAGVTLTKKSVVTVQYSNWNKDNYVSFGIQTSF